MSTGLSSYKALIDSRSFFLLNQQNLEQHKNQCGKGIPKFLSNGNPRKDFALLDLIEGRIHLKLRLQSRFDVIT